jgi:16S rRNA G966 N2-methylase RsmD
MELIDTNLEKPVELPMVKSIMDLFPPGHNLDKTKLKISNVGLYSITPYREADSVSNSILNRLDSYGLGELDITDATGGVGGNTISFSKYFRNVNSVENNNEHFEILKHNIENVYICENVKVYNCDYTQSYKTFVQDVIYIDPPWGGPDYKKYNKLKLYLSGQDIAYFIKDNLLSIDNLKLVVLKVPKNFDYDSLLETLCPLVTYIDLETVKEGRGKYNIVYIKKKDIVKNIT